MNKGWKFELPNKIMQTVSIIQEDESNSAPAFEGVRDSLTQPSASRRSDIRTSRS